ncbi:unnamed protein product [Rotaria socialis]|uniref:Alpha/beta hydrolase fold-3 domain-containing protein n=1 Tax=Rotaria socialis TaxID=392032 RepID=A0A817RPC3_9BILA|nr:unnamed protein product [Rotaria socialis]CAF3253090.1 unnamed protein product [Rotaria socialis]CAF3361695.1 unnamed protein product [Rotaria socialis]CAF3585371.1 unnamed protein product [Rotaria socialis]CAF3617720.1 unnamed protein product [Rotaria socialis]
MAFFNSLFSIIKKLTILAVLVAIVIPIYYNSTNPKYLGLRFLHSLISIKNTFVSDTDRPMLSPEYRAFESMLRRRPLFQIDPNLDPLELAKNIRASFPLDTIVPRSSSCHVDKHVYENEGHTVDAHWIHHERAKPKLNADRIIIYLHGGGYIVGDVQAYSGFECHLSRLFNVTVIHLEYRLVPEHPLPAAVDDALTLYRALLHGGISASRLAIMGDSAGGGLTLLTIQALLARQLPIPRAAVTMSPWADFSASGQSYTRNRFTDLMIRAESLAWGIQRVLGPNHEQILRDDPSYSPLFGSFKGFPPLYITAGTAEILEDDAKGVANKARAEEVDITLEMGQNLMHVHPLFVNYFPEARDTLENIRRWLEPKFQ